MVSKYTFFIRKTLLDQVGILHMPRQLSCCDMWEIFTWLDC